MFRGKREENVDYFDDILGQTGGIHEGRAMNEFETVQEKIAPDGLQIAMSCHLCGKKALVTLEWEELYVVGANGPGAAPVLPQNWQYSDNNADAFIAIRCPKCGADAGIVPHMTPEDARTAVNTAQSRGFIRPDAAAVWRQKVMAARQG
jgi:hypothetical protein